MLYGIILYSQTLRKEAHLLTFWYLFLEGVSYMKETKKTKRKKNNENLYNRLTFIGVIVVVLSLALAMGIKGHDLKKKEQAYSIRIESLEKQVAQEEERAEELELHRVYVTTKEYIEKIAKEKLGLVNKDEILLKPSDKKQ